MFILINWLMSFDCIRQVPTRSDTLPWKANNAHCIFFVIKCYLSIVFSYVIWTDFQVHLSQIQLKMRRFFSNFKLSYQYKAFWNHLDLIKVQIYKFMKILRMLKKFMYRFLLVHYINPINGLLIDWLETDQWSIKIFIRSIIEKFHLKSVH